MGAISPERWHRWQLFCKIGRTSLLNVTVELDAATAVIPITEKASETRSMFILQSSLAREFPRNDMRGASGNANGSALVDGPKPSRHCTSELTPTDSCSPLQNHVRHAQFRGVRDGERGFQRVTMVCFAACGGAKCPA